MSLRITEIDQHTVAHVLRHEPAEALHGLGDGLLVSGNDLAQVLGVHTRRKRGRAHEVREHYRDLAAPAGSVCVRCDRGGGDRGGVSEGVDGDAAAVLSRLAISRSNWRR